MVAIGRFLSFLLFAISVSAANPPRIESGLNRSEVNVGEPVVLTIQVTTDGSGDVGKPVLMGVEAFEVQPPNLSVSARAEFGPQGLVSSRITTYSFVIIPQSVGTFEVGAGEVRVGGETYRSPPQRLKVLKAGARKSAPQRPGGASPQQDPFGEEADPFDVLEDQFLQQLQRRGLQVPGVRPQIGNPEEAFSIQVEVDKSQAYVGEQVTANYWLYTRYDLRGIDTLKYPTLKSFWKEDIEVATSLNWQSEVINGVPYRKALLASYALFPLREGAAVVDAYKAKCTVLMGGGFGFGQPYTFTKSSQEPKIKVLALPTQDRPKDFGGGIGEFEMRTLIPQRQVPAHAPFTVKVRFEGRGNAKAIELPMLNLPPQLEIYSQRDESKFFPNGTSYKEFEILLIPREQGKFLFPALTSAFFSPSKKAYVPIQSEPVEIVVGAGARPQGSGDGANSPAPAIKPTGPAPILEWREPRWNQQQEDVFWLLLFVGTMAFLGFRLIGEIRGGQKKVSLLRVLSKNMKIVDAHAKKGDFRAFGTAAMNTVTLVLGELAGEPGTDQEVEKYLLKLSPSLRASIETDLKQVVQIIEVLAFAPEETVKNLAVPAKMAKTADELRRVLEKAVGMAQESGKQHLEARGGGIA